MTAARLPVPLFAAAGYFLPRLLFLDSRIAPHIHWGDVTSTLCDFPDGLTDLASPDFWQAWRERWEHTAQTYDKNAAAAATRQGRRENLRRASACYHWAEFMYFEDKTEKSRLRSESRRLFEESLDGSGVDRTVSSIEVDGVEVRYATYYPLGQGSSAAPCVLISNGLDSMTEIEPLSLGEYYLDRGVAVVLFDGPGQGTDLGRHPLRLDMETVCAALVDELSADTRIDSGALGFVGISFGGHIALRVARHSSTFRCVVNYSGGPTVSRFAELPRRLKQDFAFALMTEDDEVQATLDAMAIRSDSAPAMPVLSVHGARDDIFPVGDLRRLHAEWNADRDLLVYPDEGHVCLNRLAEIATLTADWVASCLQSR